MAVAAEWVVVEWAAVVAVAAAECKFPDGAGIGIDDVSSRL